MKGKNLKAAKIGSAALMAAAMTVNSVPALTVNVIAAEQEAASQSAESTKIVNLKVEGKVNPLGVDTATPVFAWQMTSDAIGVSQASYQVQVTKADGTVVWDSGKVEADTSIDVKYAGEALEASTAYEWKVTVEDNYGNTFESEAASFETSLLSGSLEAWDGAEWIGADELTIQASARTNFDIESKMQIPEGSTSAGFVFGANDFRLNNKLFNVDGMEGENYVRLELDVSGVGTDEGAALKIYRVGYFQEDTAEEPFMVINTANNPDTNLNEIITEENKNAEHTWNMHVDTSALTLTIDGVTVSTGNQESQGWDGTVTVSPVTAIELSKLGTGDKMTFPNLNSVGFSAGAGQKAVFTDYKMTNPGTGTGEIFGAETGATYSIWAEKEGLIVDGSTVTVDGGENGVVAYADPSFGGEPYVRTEFELEDKEVASARLYVSFQGIGDFFMNGEAVAPEEWFKQGSMEYREEIGYNVYDVTGMLTTGTNAMGAVMGEGWWTGHPEQYDDSAYNYYGDQEAMLAKLVVTFADGTTQTVVSDDDTWQYSGDGAVRLASLFEGEHYDATKELEGFAEAGYNADGWRNAAQVETRKPFANQQLVVRHDDSVHVIKTLDAELVGENKEGTGSFIYDLGENVAAVPEITIPEEFAKEGETITIRVAEILYPELEEYGDLAGNLLQENYRAALTTDFYTMKAGEQTFVPDLTFHGYRYLEITGFEEALPAENVKSLVLSSIDNTATYDSSNELVNRLFLNGQNSEASNYITLPTDCPQRNERMGWMGDANVYALAGSYNANTYQFMRQWLNCVREDQGADGMTGHVSPNYPSFDLETGEVFVGGLGFGITWNSALVFIPYYLYEQYGDVTILEENMDAIYKYMENLESNPLEANAALTAQTGFLCDHLALVSTDGSMLGNAQYVRALEATAEMAAALGQTDKAEKYAGLYEAAKAAWNELYIDPETGRSRSADGTEIHTQASYASPLNYGAVSEENLEKFLANYIDTIENPKDDEGNALTPYTITTGFNATPNVLNALSDNGRADVAYKMLECTDYASWLYPVTQGATSIWERWNSYTVEAGFGGNNSMNSFNHYSLGAVTSWMMDTQLGIKYDTENAGYKHFVLQPVAGGTFTYANGTFESAYGQIASGWTADENGMLTYTAAVPANTTATLYLPMSEEQAAALDLPEGAEFVGAEEHNGQTCAKIELVSGTFEFALPTA